MPDTLWAFCMVSTFSFLSPSLLVLWMPISCAMVSHLVSHFDRGDFPRTSIIHGWVRIEQFLSLCWRRWFKTGGSCNRCRRTSQFESRPFFSLFEISKLASSCSWAGVDHTSYHRSRLNFWILSRAHQRTEQWFSAVQCKRQGLFQKSREPRNYYKKGDGHRQWRYRKNLVTTSKQGWMVSGTSIRWLTDSGEKWLVLD